MKAKDAYKRKYPHLFGVLELEGAPGLGMCIHRAAAFVLGRPRLGDDRRGLPGSD